MRYLLLCLILSGSFVAKAQTNLSTSDFHDQVDEVFTHEVKSADEFIERFNDNANSFIREEYQKKGKELGMNRSKMITSLFNLEDKKWRSLPEARQFIKEVADSLHPCFIRFQDSNWYAYVNCLFKYEGKEVVIPVVLHVNVDSNHACKWMIAGIGNSDVLNKGHMYTPVKPKVPNKTNFIPTSSHALQFIELHDILTRKLNPYYYFEYPVQRSINGQHFISLVAEGKLTFDRVNDMSFYFFNVPGWIFKLNYFRREQYNSGWLISDLMKKSEKEKTNYRKSILGL